MDATDDWVFSGAGEDAGRLKAALSAWHDRERSLDPQLPVRTPERGAAEIVVSGDIGPHALGTVRSELFSEDSAEALWGALQRDAMELWWGGDRAALGLLLDRWIARTSGDFGPDDEWETAMTLDVPARDSAAAIPLLARGFAPIGVTGIRAGKRGASTGPAIARLRELGYDARAATSRDVSLLASLDAELLEHDAQHGGVSVRANAEQLLADSIAERLARDPEWTWVIQDDGNPVGYLSIEINRDHHLAQCAPGGNVAHIQAMYLRRGVRGGGLGDAVVGLGHGALEEAGYDRVTLGYSAVNPRSGPFWCRQGYRPLWNTWQRRPAF